MALTLSASLATGLVASDVARVPAASRGVDLYAIPPARVEGRDVDGGKLARSVVRAIEDGLLSATPVRLTLDQILRTSTPSPTASPTPRSVAYVSGVQTGYTAPIKDQGWYDYLFDIVSQYPWDAVTGTRILLCESGGNATSYNPYGPYYGGWQIDYAFDGWDDLEINTRVAYETKYVPAGGWSPWAWCWRNG